MGEEKRGGKKKLLFFLAGVLVAASVAGGYVVFKGGVRAEAAGAEQAAEQEEPGPIVTLDAITLNLADTDRYLKVGIALQLPADGDPEEVTEQSARALDETIRFLGGHTFRDLAGPKQRERARTELARRFEKLFHGDVVDVYFTEFVMQ